MTGPRVRFAPSPTGFLHVGSARACLFNWLFAHQTGGTFILRIEDTDAQRNRPEWFGAITSAMNWLGLDYDEGPFLQSDLLADHVASADAMYANGYLYPCDCTREEIDERVKNHAKPGYDGYCRDRHLERSETTALRFRVPDIGVTVVPDVIRGDVTFPHESYEDFIVVRSNGVVLYPLANAVDDRSMKITHIIRGEDLLPTTPKQVMMWEALNHCAGIEPVDHPKYAHLPLLVNDQRKKLSKRKDPVAVESYRDQGYLADAMVNYLALLGWSPKGDVEMVARDTLVEQFRLEDVSHSPALFDVKKLLHMNGEYIRMLTTQEFIDAAQPWVAPWATEWRPTKYEAPWTEQQFDAALFSQVAHLVQERVATLGEIPAMVRFFFLDDVPFDDAAFDKTLRSNDVAKALLVSALDEFSSVEWSAAALHESTLQLGERHGLVLRKSQAPIRVAVTGTLVGPPLFESMELLGRDQVRKRLRDALARAAE
ncbi:MAG: glutamate--tRNA ligase [Acidimicrobiales bacterium]